MQINFTKHALARMEERGITQAEVLATLAQPVKTVSMADECFEARGMIVRDGKELLLRVIYSQHVVLTVITVMATSQMKRYL